VTALFELDQVCVELSDALLLDNVSCELPDAGITVLLGPSGAGKTTLLRLLNRLEVPTSGRVRFRGEPVDALDPLKLRRQVGMVFQRPAVFPGTVRDNLLVAQPGASDDHLAPRLQAAGLDPGLLDQVADTLSGGEAQRLCLARTLTTEPQVLLMDEPTSSLDRDARGHLEATARDLVERGMPMIWVTHDLDQADRLADHRILLVAGRVGSNHEMDHYLSRPHLHPEGDDGDG
jgi:putative ABC transport system ATP-binding protein